MEEINGVQIKEEIQDAICDNKHGVEVKLSDTNNAIMPKFKKSQKKDSKIHLNSTTVIDSFITQEWDENDECQEGVLVKLKKPLTICYSKNGYNFCGLKTHRWHIRRSMGNRGKFICLMKCCVSGQFCNKSFGQKCHWVRHCKERHVENPVRFSCECCQKSYAQRESLLNHVYCHHDETEKKKKYDTLTEHEPMAVEE